MMVAQLRDAHPDFERLGVRVVAIGFGTQDETDAFCHELHSPFRCLADPQRHLYDAFGLERDPPLRRLLSPRQAGAYFVALRRGFHPRRTRLSWKQLGGVFLIDSNDEVVYEHRNRFPADNPPIDELLRAAARTTARA